MYFYAIPPADVARIEQRSHPRLGAEPTEIREIVVACGHEVTGEIGTGRRIQVEVARGRGVAPHLRGHRFRPARRRQADRPGELVASTPDPRRLVAYVQAPVQIPIERRPRIHGPQAGRHLSDREMQPPSVHLPHGKARAHAVRAAHADASGADEPIPCVVVLEVLAQPILLEVVAPDPSGLGLVALDRARGRWGGRRRRRRRPGPALTPRRATDEGHRQHEALPPPSAPLNDLAPHRPIPAWKSLAFTRAR